MQLGHLSHGVNRAEAQKPIQGIHLTAAFIDCGTSGAGGARLVEVRQVDSCGAALV